MNRVAHGEPNKSCPKKTALLVNAIHFLGQIAQVAFSST